MITVIESPNQLDLLTHNFSFKQKLRDIIAKIQITSELTITYQDYEPLEIDEHLKEYLKQISPADRDRYLTVKLQQYIYDILSLDLEEKDNSAVEMNSKLEDNGDLEEIANYVNKWSRTKFYKQLTQNNHGQGYSDPNWRVIKQEGDYWQVTKNDLTLQIKPEKHLAEPLQKLQPGKLVAIKMPPNLVDHGMYIAVGDAGSTNSQDSPEEFTIVQLYFNVNPDGAALLLDNLTRKLNAIKIPFDFKLAYDESDFDDLDAVVLDIKSNDFELVYAIVKNIYQDNKSYFQPKVPFFCKFLAPGLGLAEKPQSPSFAKENIGQHYCGIIAQALVKLWRKNSLVDTNKLDYILTYLSKVGVDLENLHLNPNSKETNLKHNKQLPSKT